MNMPFRDRHMPVPITEKLTATDDPSISVELAELPEMGSVQVPDKNEVQYLPTTEKDFCVDYASARVFFHPCMVGKEVTVHYAAIGSVLRASALNAIVAELQALRKEVDALKVHFH